MSYELEPRYDGRKSFYGKAEVRQEGDKLILRSYSTDVAYIRNGKAYVNDTYSQTTLRHIKEFLKQQGFQADNAKQILADYGKKEDMSYQKPKDTSTPTSNEPAVPPDGKLFKVNNEMSVVAQRKSTRNGFKHVVTLYVNGIEGDSATVHYLNRTWESYEYETALNKLADKLSEPQKTTLKNYIKNPKRGEEALEPLRSVGMIASLGEVFGSTQKEKNDWKARMIKAGLGGKGLQMPEDWDELSEDEKEKRLNKIIKHLREK